MRAHDWSTSPLGHPETWPQSLRSVVGLLLGSRFPMFVAWGEELGFLYNDAYAETLGAKHPHALGARFRDIWSEIWPDIAPLIDAALAGEATYREDLPLLMNRKGFDEQTWFTFSYSPVRDTHGRVAGMFCVCTETTRQVLADRQQAFWLGFEERLRGLSSPRAIMSAAVEALGRHLGAIRAGYSEVQDDDETILCEACYADGVEPILGRFSLAEFGSDSIMRQRKGRTEICADVQADPGQVQATWAAIETRSYVSVPLVRDGRFTASFYVNFREVRNWSPEEVALIEEVAARTWDAVERAKAETALRESEERLARERAVLATLVEHLPVGVIVVDRDAQPLMHNSAYGQIVPEAVIPSRLPAAQERWIGYDEQGQRIRPNMYPGARALRGELVRDAEYLHQAPGGRETWTRVSGVPLRDAAGQVIGALCVVVDIDAYKRVEAALRDLNETLEERVADALAARQVLADVVESTKAAVLACDLDYRILAINRANAAELERVYGRRPKLGDHLLDLIADLPEHQAQVARNWDRALAGEEFMIVEEFGDAAHERVSYEVRFNVLRDRNGNRVGAFQTAYDVSDRVRAQEALEAAQEALRQAQKMEAVGQLTGGVAHDFNNLLTVIRSSAGLLRRPDLADERRRIYLDAISDTVDRAAKLTGQLLAFARRQALKPEVFDASERVQALNDMLRTILGGRIQVVTEVSPERCLVEADVGQFETALVNMAVNARDAMDGEGRLTVRVERVSAVPADGERSGQTGAFVTMSITDTGAGIPPEHLSRIFEPFFTTKDVGKGTGLGLSQVYGFAKQSGGDLRVTSQLGRGTSFTLYLPQVEHGEVTGPAETRRADAAEQGQGRRILVVEDNTEVGTFSTQLLQDLGYETTWAVNAEEALARLAENGGGFDVVFSDVVMPGMSGMELGHEIRRRYPGLPIVLTSGYSEVLADEGRHGFELLQKPYAVEDLSRVLRRVSAGRIS
ncbi:response regulator [Rubellimicrobium roseum]|uniref:histidine kinase n=2 Tax=Rubellimicrobium roseum TaxID=687525 RepID=A0A5C4N768_9RHOB|nr:response regulator [Rubellimicrobium roseum]